MNGRSKNHIIVACLLLVLGLNGFALCADIDWDGGGWDNSFCTPENWVGDVVPGPSDRASLCCDDDHVIIDCVVDVGEFRMADCGGPGLIVVDIVSGGVLTANGARAGGGDCRGELNLSGTGIMTVNGEFRFFDNGQNGLLTIADDAMMHVAGRFRMGDGGDPNVTVNISGGSLVVGDEYWRLGDDGGGQVNISGGSVVVNGQIRWMCRENTQIITVTGGEQWCADTYEIGGSTGGKNADAYCEMNMSGGIINAGEIDVGGGYEDTTLNVDGGLMISRGRFRIRKPANDTAVVNLTGGVLQVGSLEIETGSSMDIEASAEEGGPIGSAGGTLILEGNQLSAVYALADAGTLTGCGAARGISVYYDIKNPGKTTVTACCDLECGFGAWRPWPADGQDKIQSAVTEVILSWIAGDWVGSRGRHLIYFGSDETAVENAEIGDPENIAVNRAIENSINVGNLPLWQTFYWRIDEFNQDATTTKGDIWEFTTGCELIPGDLNMDCLLNFEDFAELAVTFGEEEFWP